MATQRQLIKNHISIRLRSKRRGRLLLADIDSAWTAASQPHRAQLMAAFQQGNAEKIGEVLQRMVEAWLAQEADTEADAILVDDAISLDEFEQINGPF